MTDKINRRDLVSTSGIGAIAAMWAGPFGSGMVSGSSAGAVSMSDLQEWNGSEFKTAKLQGEQAKIEQKLGDRWGVRVRRNISFSLDGRPWVWYFERKPWRVFPILNPEGSEKVIGGYITKLRMDDWEFTGKGAKVTDATLAALQAAEYHVKQLEQRTKVFRETYWRD